jgi:hypothetical protein
MKEENSGSGQIEKLTAKLRSNSEDTVLDTLDIIREEGNATILPAVLDLLADTDNPEIEAGIIQLLFDLQDEDAVPYLVSALNNQRLKYYYSFLISAFWQSALDGSDHLTLFITKAVKGDYMVCLEALTVIENFDTTFENKEIQHCASMLMEALDREKAGEKKELLKSMLEVVEQLSTGE